MLQASTFAVFTLKFAGREQPNFREVASREAIITKPEVQYATVCPKFVKLIQLFGGLPLFTSHPPIAVAFTSDIPELE
jgi:hypothetical protein